MSSSVISPVNVSIIVYVRVSSTTLLIPSLFWLPLRRYTLL